MEIQGMAASLKNNKRKRKSIFDSKKKKSDATYTGFVDDNKRLHMSFLKK